MNTANTINTTRSLTRVIAGALLSGGIAAAGLGLASGTAEANIWIHWCPGDDPIGGVGVAYQIENWDYNVCHDYTHANGGIIDQTGFHNYTILTSRGTGHRPIAACSSAPTPGTRNVRLSSRACDMMTALVGSTPGPPV